MQNKRKETKIEEKETRNPQKAPPRRKTQESVGELKGSPKNSRASTEKLSFWPSKNSVEERKKKKMKDQIERKKTMLSLSLFSSH